MEQNLFNLIKDMATKLENNAKGLLELRKTDEEKFYKEIHEFFDRCELFCTLCNDLNISAEEFRDIFELELNVEDGESVERDKLHILIGSSTAIGSILRKSLIHSETRVKETL